MQTGTGSVRTGAGTGTEPGPSTARPRPGRRPLDRPPRLVHEQLVGQPPGGPGVRVERHPLQRRPDPHDGLPAPGERGRAARPCRRQRVPPAVRGVVVEVGDRVEQVPPEQATRLRRGARRSPVGRRARRCARARSRPRPPSAPWPPPASPRCPSPPRAAGPARRAGPPGRTRSGTPAGSSARDHVVATLVPAIAAGRRANGGPRRPRGRRPRPRRAGARSRPRAARRRR